MLDTIRLRLYGILDTKGDTLSVIQKENGLSNFVAPEHNELYLKILEKRGKDFTMRVIFNKEKQAWENVSQEEYNVSEYAKNTFHDHSRQMIRFVDEEKEKEINMKINGTYRVPSSNSNVTFNVSENGSYIDFEFSIPKYLYGHSLAEFIPQQGSDLKFQQGINLLNFDQQAKYLYKRLNNFIDKFFLDLCGYFQVDTLPNKKYVEIRRLDICYNQWFPTKDEALMYLREQKKLDMKRQRQNANLAKSFDTSISYHSSTGSYFKIYHKGSEYSKSEGDLKKHLEINREYIDKLTRRMARRHKDVYTKYRKVIWSKMEAKGKGESFVIDEETKKEIKETVDRIYTRIPYKIDFLKQEMDKVLRYEISLSSKFFSNLYKSKIFRCGSKKYGLRADPYHSQAIRTYKDVKNALDNRTRKDRAVPPRDRQLYKEIHEWKNRSVSLILGKSHVLSRFERKAGTDWNEATGRYKISRFEYAHTVLGKKDVGHFSDFFLRKCVDHFQELVNYYQIKTLKPYDEILTRMHAYNQEAERKTEEFNLMNEHLTLTWDGKPVRKKNGQKVTKASQLLKRSELVEMGMKKVNTTILGTIVTQLEKGKSLDQIFRELKTSSSAKSRIKQDLKIFGVFEQSLNTQINIEVRTDFFQYYWNTDSEFYRAKFYTEPKHFNYGQYNVRQDNVRAKEIA
jgi:hypothetical protein